MEAIPKIGGYLSCVSAQVFHPLDALEESRLEISYFVLRATIRHMVVSSRRANNRLGRAGQDATRVPCSEKKTAEIERRPLIEVVRGPMAAADVVRPPRSVRRCGYNRTEGGRVRDVLQEASVV